MVVKLFLGPSSKDKFQVKRLGSRQPDLILEYSSKRQITMVQLVAVSLSFQFDLFIVLFIMLRPRDTQRFCFMATLMEMD